VGLLQVDIAARRALDNQDAFRALLLRRIKTRV
jgi:hypothetical protein